ncbi:hypothetical protein J6590_046457 [Homalodisca vitripennis]|nr:hypothetical protein J6590_046457 [Homalodisca vitripennis]
MLTPSVGRLVTCHQGKRLTNNGISHLVRLRGTRKGSVRESRSAVSDEQASSRPARWHEGWRSAGAPRGEPI